LTFTTGGLATQGALGLGASAVTAGAVGGASAGGVSSLLTQTANGRQIDWTDVGISTAVGGALGGSAGYVGSGQAAQTGGQSPVGALTNPEAGAVASGGAGGGAQGYQVAEAGSEAIDLDAQALKAANTEAITTRQAAEREFEFDNLFGIRQDDPYMKFNVDTSSSQEGKL
jgi:hypothetical protein